MRRKASKVWCPTRGEGANSNSALRTLHFGLKVLAVNRNGNIAGLAS